MRLCWSPATAVAPVVGYSVHPYLEHHEYGHHCDNRHTREEGVVDVAHFNGMIWFNSSRRQLPIQRSAIPFCQGAWMLVRFGGSLVAVSN